MEVIDQQGSDWGGENERVILLVTYVLHGIGAFTGITAIIAVIINYIKIKQTRSELVRSHHRWLLRTFWWSLLWLSISYVLFLVLIGFVGFFVLWVWWLYRVIYGAINFFERKPMPG